MIDEFDMLIAGQAQSEGLTVVTDNVKHFNRIEGLKIAKAQELTEIAKVDGCTGATMSTKALQQNIKAALEYYKKKH